MARKEGGLREPSSSVSEDWVSRAIDEDKSTSREKGNPEGRN